MPNFDIETSYKNKKVVGIDEAGLGPLAGPIVVAGCYIENYHLSHGLQGSIDDSKKLSKNKRESIFEKIISDKNIVYAISIIDNKTIDEIGLSSAWKKGVSEVISKIEAEVYIIDGNKKIEAQNKICESVVKGDQKSFSIATASILAKVTRDRIMERIHDEFPCYGFNKHVGYGTKQHIESIKEYGPCKYHRMSYAPLKNLNSFA